MPIIQVKMICGRDDNKKRNLAKALSEAAAKILEIQEERINVIIDEVPSTQWMVGGEMLNTRTHSKE